MMIMIIIIVRRRRRRRKAATLGDQEWKKSGVAGNRVLLRLRKVTATRQLKADHSLTVKATKPKIQWNIQR